MDSVEGSLPQWSLGNGLPVRSQCHNILPKSTQNQSFYRCFFGNQTTNYRFEMEIPLMQNYNLVFLKQEWCSWSSNVYHIYILPFIAFSNRTNKNSTAQTNWNALSRLRADVQIIILKIILNRKIEKHISVLLLLAVGGHQWQQQ